MKTRNEEETQNRLHSIFEQERKRERRPRSGNKGKRQAEEVGQDEPAMPTRGSRTENAIEHPL
jgi:hypothetical protein